MPNITIQARIKPELKQEAEEILGAIGLTASDAIRIFLQQVVSQHRRSAFYANHQAS